jgi:hypothetical protein
MESVVCSVIFGIVRDLNGNSVTQARVYFTDGPVPWSDIATLTDSDGTFSLSAPSAGTYEIECVADGFIPTVATVKVTGDKETHLEIYLST